MCYQRPRPSDGLIGVVAGVAAVSTIVAPAVVAVAAFALLWPPL